MCGNLSSSSIKGTATGYIGVLESTNKSKSLSCSNHLVSSADQLKQFSSSISDDGLKVQSFDFVKVIVPYVSAM
jgi:hypothetical protein